jgi:hypothetical protein
LPSGDFKHFLELKTAKASAMSSKAKNITTTIDTYSENHSITSSKHQKGSAIADLKI